VEFFLFHVEEIGFHGDLSENEKDWKQFHDGYFLFLEEWHPSLEEGGDFNEKGGDFQLNVMRKNAGCSAESEVLGAADTGRTHAPANTVWFENLPLHP
jgi:hypothetical protein